MGFSDPSADITLISSSSWTTENRGLNNCVCSVLSCHQVALNLMHWAFKIQSLTCVFSPSDPPSVTLSVQPQTVTEGAKVLFICSASANPEITGYRYRFE